MDGVDTGVCEPVTFRLRCFFFVRKTTRALRALQSALYTARITPAFHFLFCKTPECFSTTKIKRQTTSAASQRPETFTHPHTSTRTISSFYIYIRKHISVCSFNSFASLFHFFAVGERCRNTDVCSAASVCLTASCIWI